MSFGASCCERFCFHAQDDRKSLLLEKLPIQVKRRHHDAFFPVEIRARPLDSLPDGGVITHAVPRAVGRWIGVAAGSSRYAMLLRFETLRPMVWAGRCRCAEFHYRPKPIPRGLVHR